MKFWKLTIPVFLVLLSIPASAAEESVASSDASAVDIRTGTDQEKIQAIETISKSKDKSQIPALIDVLNNSQNPRVASDAAIALGVIGEKGESTTALKQKIESTENGDVVYACILALFNIHRKDEKRDPEAEAVIKYAFENRRQDPFVADMLDKLKDRFLSEE